DTAVIAGTLNGTGTLTANDYALYGATINANLGGGMLYVGTGTSLLNGTAGATSFEIGGTLILGAAERINNSAMLQSDSGGILDLGAFAETVDTAVIAGTLDGTGTLTANDYALYGATINANLGGGTSSPATTSAIVDDTVDTVAASRPALLGAEAIDGSATVLFDADGGFGLATNSGAIVAAVIAGTDDVGAAPGADQQRPITTQASAPLAGGRLYVGAGTSLLNGTAGALTVEIAGTLVLGADERLNDAAALQINSGGVLDLGAFAETVDTAAIAGTLAGTGTLIANETGLFGATIDANIATATLVVGAGNSVLNGTATSDEVRIVDGTLTLGGDERLSDSAIVGIGSAGSFDLAGFDETIGGLYGNGSVVLGSGTLTVDQAIDASFDGVISGTGGFTKSGDGLLQLLGANTYSGPTLVNGGNLAVNGSLASTVTIANGATVSGVGTVGGLVVGAGSILSPGNGMGAFNIADNATFNAGSFYDINVSATSSDLTFVGGSLTLQGGTVRVTAEGSGFNPFSRYVILDAAGGVNGYFAGVTSNYAFLTPGLEYSANQVILALRRNDIVFADVAIGPNQGAVAGALQSLPIMSDLYTALLVQSPESAQRAYGLLSGENYASQSTTMLTESRLVRNALLREGRTDAEGAALWLDAMGSQSTYDADDRIGTARLESDRLGLLGGLTYGGAGFSATIAGGYSDADMLTRARSTEGKIKTTYVGGQASYVAGPLHVQLGGSLAWHDIANQRSVVFPAFADALSSTQDGRTHQIFGEIGYSLVDTAARMIQPFLGYTYLDTQIDGATESGGSAALAIASVDRNVSLVHAGLRGSARVTTVSSAVLVPSFSVAWQHAGGDLAGTSTASFANFAGSAPFTVTGASIPRDAAQVEAGLKFDLGALEFGASYDGLIAKGFGDHSGKINLTIKF
ncbi:MAG: autotransporter domain-containing protein, partial [Sphingomonadales bacterium]|nr:autotransporter domain-containing protein [Sphingomonadales bacterium]